MATFAVERFPVIGDRRFKLGAAMPAEVPQLGSGHALPSERPPAFRARNIPLYLFGNIANQHGERRESTFAELVARNICRHRRTWISKNIVSRRLLLGSNHTW
jgi:hypothetical protein